MSLSEIKRQARSSLHGAMAEPASYQYRDGPVIPSAEQALAGLSLTVRWHNRRAIIGERTTDDVGIVEGINRLVFQSDQLEALGLTLERNALVSIPGYEKTLRLDSEGDPDGPLNIYWDVIEIDYQVLG